MRMTDPPAPTAADGVAPQEAELPPPPRKRHRAINAIGLALVIASGLIALMVFRSSPGGPGHYEGQAVSFDYPSDWHVFDLVAGWQQLAAYGPVSGGDDDYIAVFYAPPDTKGMTLEDFEKWGASSEGIRLTRPARTIAVNGLTGYLLSVARTGSHGQALEGRSILVKGEQGDYLIACQYGKHAKTEVLTGCNMMMDTLKEVPAHSIANASACTDGELALLSRVPLPQGAVPKEPRRAKNDLGFYYCDLMVNLPPGYDADALLDYFRNGMTKAGWRYGDTYMVRTFEGYKVWQIRAYTGLGPPGYTVEVYAEGGYAHHFFITVMDY